MGCSNLHKCATEALTRLNLIPPKHNPTKQEPPDRMSLTRIQKLRNDRARQCDREITFNPLITCKDSLAECFQIFTDTDRYSNDMTRQYRH